MNIIDIGWNNRSMCADGSILNFYLVWMGEMGGADQKSLKIF